MLDRAIEERRRRFDELHVLLADPNVISNTAEYQALAKELASLTPLVNQHKEYERVKADLKDLEKMLGDGPHAHDKDFLLMAQEEKAGLERRLAECASRLEDLMLEKDSGAERNIILEIRAGTSVGRGSE